MLKPLITITKALSDESRVRMLLALWPGELCICQLIELLALAPSTVSKHMSILTQAGLTQCRKAGRWRYYRLPDLDEATPLVSATLAWLQSTAAALPQAAQDRKLLKTIRRKSPEEASCCYRK